MKKYIVITCSILLLFGSFNVYSQIKIMSFNIRYDNPNDNENWWENRKPELANLIEHYHPDFLGIQEGLIKQVEYIKENTSNYNYLGLGRDDGKQKGEFSAIYYDTTKFKLIKTQTFWLSQTPDTVSVGWDASMERIYTYGVFLNKGTKETMNIFNAHFDHLGAESRKMSAKTILSKINDLGLSNSKLVVMGDLNCEPNSEPIRILKLNLDDGIELTDQAFDGPLGTFNNFNKDKIPEKRIDYIFTKNLRVISYRHINDKRNNNLYISDHLPVLIEVK